MMTRKPAFLVVFITALMLLGGNLSACNTVKGAGQDIKSAGKAIEHTAEDTKSY